MPLIEKKINKKYKIKLEGLYRNPNHVARITNFLISP